MSAVRPLSMKAKDDDRRRWQSWTLLRLEEGDPLQVAWHTHRTAFLATMRRAAALWAQTPNSSLDEQGAWEQFCLPSIGPLGDLPVW